MKASEVIQKLEELIIEHGDLKCCVASDCGTKCWEKQKVPLICMLNLVITSNDGKEE